MGEKMLKRLLAAAMIVIATPFVRGQAVPSVSLDPSSPSDRVTADIFVDLAPSDAFSAAGIRALAMNGATFHYARDADPNSPYPDQLFGPYGSGPVGDQYVTCFSKPRVSRNAPGRFNDAADVSPGGRYNYAGTIAQTVASANEVNTSYYADPLPGPDSPSVDGYIGRIALDFDLPAGQSIGIGLAADIPVGATVIMLSEGHDPFETLRGLGVKSYDYLGLFFLDWAIWSAPTPTCVGDVNDSNTVDLADLTILLAHFGFSGTPEDGDLDGSGVIDLDDLVLLLSNFGSDCA
jgi:hypothetical protein